VTSFRSDPGHSFGELLAAGGIVDCGEIGFDGDQRRLEGSSSGDNARCEIRQHIDVGAVDDSPRELDDIPGQGRGVQRHHGGTDQRPLDLLGT
jgi:hypothetical protein